MGRDSLHAIDRSLSLYSTNPLLSSTYWNLSPSTMGLLKAPPLPLLQPPPQPPPLLPLPRRTSSFPGPSCSPTPAIKNNNNNKKTRDHGFTSRKPTKSSSTKHKKEDKRSWDSVTVSSSGKLRSPKLPKNFGGEDEVEVVPRSVVFTVSPPPSSLPLPTFSLRPKLGIDAGATDDLRRILGLQ